MSVSSAARVDHLQITDSDKKSIYLRTAVTTALITFTTKIPFEKHLGPGIATAIRISMGIAPPILCGISGILYSSVKRIQADKWNILRNSYAAGIVTGLGIAILGTAVGCPEATIAPLSVIAGSSISFISGYGLTRKNSLARGLKG